MTRPTGTPTAASRPARTSRRSRRTGSAPCAAHARSTSPPTTSEPAPARGGPSGREDDLAHHVAGDHGLETGPRLAQRHGRMDERAGAGGDEEAGEALELVARAHGGADG